MRRGRLDRMHALGQQRLGRRPGAGAAAAVVAPDRSGQAPRPGQSSRRRCRSCAARSRTARPPPSPPHRRRCRRRAAYRSPPAWRADARWPPCPVEAITGERPGRWKVARHVEVACGQAEPPQATGSNRSICMSRCAVRSVTMKPTEHVDHADHHQNEEGRSAGLRHQQEFDQHGDEQDHRQDVIDDRANAGPGGLEDLERQQQDATSPAGSSAGSRSRSCRKSDGRTRSCRSTPRPGMRNAIML